MAFLESPRFPATSNYGVIGGPMFKTEIVETNSGKESANSVWPYPLNTYDLVIENRSVSSIEDLLKFFNAMKGRFNRFRFKDHMDYKSSDIGSSIAFTDQECSGDKDGTNTDFQLLKEYGAGSETTYRVIKKPVSGTVICGIGSVQEEDFSIDTTTGIITFDDITQNITAITQANPCVVTLDSNPFVTNQTVYISGVSGMTQINDDRYKITNSSGSDITLDLDSSGFSAYTSGGTAKSLPQSGETVTAGFEFDVPVRFRDDQFPARIDANTVWSLSSLPLEEVRL